jgi:uncharacterized protein (DUF488 family)
MTSAAPKLFTIGYQGKTIEELLAELQAAGVELLIDVRRRPISRKPGFAKKRLGETLTGAGIDYEHRVDLGMPEELMAHKNDRDNSGILHAYDRYFDEHPAYVSDAVDLARTKPSCLLCFEADINHCHRTRLALAMQRLVPFEIVNL